MARTVRGVLGVGIVLSLWTVLAAADDFRPFQPLPAQPPVPASNPQSAAKIALGAQLFFDARLSPAGTVACLTCHNVLAGGEDSRARSVTVGGGSTSRNAPTLWNVGFYTAYFRDGRATSLEHAVEEQLLSAEAMAMASPEALVERVSAILGYREQFAQVFGSKNAIGLANIAKALAAYLRTLVTQDSAFDQYLRGHEQALSPQAKRGFEVYVDSGCASCHFWVNLAGPVPGLAFAMGEGFYELFPNYLGSAFDARYQLTQDVGRVTISGDETDKHMWRVTGLRNVAITAPYFHNGSVTTLAEAVRVMAKTQLNKDFTDEQIADVVAFLQSLTGRFPEPRVPRLPPSEDGSVFAKP